LVKRKAVHHLLEGTEPYLEICFLPRKVTPIYGGGEGNSVGGVRWVTGCRGGEEHPQREKNSERGGVNRIRSVESKVVSDRTVIKRVHWK